VAVAVMNEPVSKVESPCYLGKNTEFSANPANFVQPWSQLRRNFSGLQRNSLLKLSANF
jgi:hypothetical protein